MFLHMLRSIIVINTISYWINLVNDQILIVRYKNKSLQDIGQFSSLPRQEKVAREGKVIRYSSDYISLSLSLNFFSLSLFSLYLFFSLSLFSLSLSKQQQQQMHE